MNNAELRKAKEYALRSLTCIDQTEFQIRQKLQQKSFDFEIIEAVIAFLKDYNYINDLRFTEQYIGCHCGTMNRKQLLEKLYSKGIKNVDIDNYLELYQYDEKALLQKAVKKYSKNKDVSDLKVRQKILIHFTQKGYSYAMIRDVINVDMEDCIL